MVLAISFVVGGIFGFVAGMRARRWTGTYGLMLLSVVSILAGLFIFANPLIGLGTVTLVCIAGLAASGFTKLFWSFKIPAGPRSLAHCPEWAAVRRRCRDALLALSVLRSLGLRRAGGRDADLRRASRISHFWQPLNSG